MIQLPERFEEKMQCLLGSEFEEYIRGAALLWASG